MEKEVKLKKILVNFEITQEEDDMINKLKKYLKVGTRPKVFRKALIKLFDLYKERL